MFRQQVKLVICSLSLFIFLWCLHDVTMAQFCSFHADCDDGNICTDDYCDLRRHSCFYEFNLGVCDDGLYCNGDDLCYNGNCSVHSGDPCPGVSSCDEEINQCLCSSNVDCDDSNTCTSDGCGRFPPDHHVCSNISLTGTSCDDGIHCNGEDTCDNGTCVHSGNPCESHQVCIEEMYGACGLPCLTDEDCEFLDVLSCVTHICADGINGMYCDETAFIGPCDDGLYCNGDDTCDDGICSVHAGNPCPAGTLCNEATDTCDEEIVCQVDEDCDDGNICSEDFCIESNNGLSCMHYVQADGPCDDGIYCNGTDQCDAWISLACTIHSGNPCEPEEICDEEKNMCRKPCLTRQDCGIELNTSDATCSTTICANDGYCDLVPRTGETCDDELYCNGTDTCSESSTCDIHLGNPCPVGTICDEETDNCLVVGCASNDECNDGVFCNGDETCIGNFCNSGVNPCNEVEECDEENDECLGENQITSCEITIQPGRAEVFSGMDMTFTVNSTGACNGPEYDWVVLSHISSSIDQNGNYTAGINRNFFKEAVDIVRVVDHANSDIVAEAVLIVSYRSCVLIPLYGESSREVAILRSFKNEVLSQTSEGRELIKLYYLWSPLMISAVEKDDKFREEVTEMIDDILPLIERTMK